MKTLLAFYSFSGTTRSLCESLKTDNCDLFEIKEQKKRSKPGAYAIGGFQALTLRSSRIRPVPTDTEDYGRIILACPVWASGLAPAGIAFLRQANLKDKELVIICVSASGNINESRVKKAAESSSAKRLQILSHKSGDPAPTFAETGL